MGDDPDERSLLDNLAETRERRLHSMRMAMLPPAKAKWHLEEARRLTAAALSLAAARPAGQQSQEPTTPDERTRLLEEAVGHCRRGVTLEPHDLPLYEAAATCYEALLDSASAVSHLRYALSVAGGGEAVATRLAGLLYGRARGWLASGSVANAVEDLSEATALAPSDPKPWLLLAMAWVRMLPGTSAKAAAAARAASGSALQHSAATHSRGGTPGSRPGTSASHGSRPGSSGSTGPSPHGSPPPPLSAEAAAKEAKAHVAEALVCADRAVTLSQALAGSSPPPPSLDLVQALVLRAKLLWAVGQAEAGNRDFRTATRLAPWHPEVKVFDGMMARKAKAMYDAAKEAMARKDLTEATRQLSSALRVTPDDVRLYVLRASALRQAGHFADALADLDAAGRRYFVARHGYRPPPRPADGPGRGCGAAAEDGGGGQPVGTAGSPRAERNHAAQFWERDHAALAGLVAAMELATPVWVREPWEVTRQRNLVRNDLALGLIVSGRHAEALGHLDACVASEAELSQAPFAADFAAAQSEGGGGAAARTSGGVDVRFLVNRGDAYRALGRLEDALADFSRAFAADPGNWDTATRLSVVRYGLGVAALNAGRLGDAEAQLSEACALNPKVAGYFDARATCRYAAHDFSGAHADWRAALVLDPSLAHVAAKLGHTFEPSTGPQRGAGAAEGLRRKATLRATAGRVAAAEASAAVAVSGARGLASLGLTAPALLGYGGDRPQAAAPPPPLIVFGSSAGGEGGVGAECDDDDALNTTLESGEAWQRPPTPKALPSLAEAAGEARWAKGAVLSIRHAPTPIRQDSALWKLLKSGASGGDAIGPKGNGPSRASYPNDGEAKFLWGATKRIQALEDAKKLAAASSRAAFLALDGASAARRPGQGSSPSQAPAPAQGGGVSAARSVRGQSRAEPGVR